VQPPPSSRRRIHSLYYRTLFHRTPSAPPYGIDADETRARAPVRYRACVRVNLRGLLLFLALPVKRDSPSFLSLLSPQLASLCLARLVSLSLVCLSFLHPKNV